MHVILSAFFVSANFSHFYDEHDFFGYAVNALQKLLDKREAQRKAELWNAVIHNSKSHDEILQMIAD